MSEPALWTPNPPAQAGVWRIYVTTMEGKKVDITTVRGIPTDFGTAVISDPGGPREFTLTFPAVTILDRLGYGDLDWLREETNIDVVWDGELPENYPWDEWRWSGWMESFTYTFGQSANLQVDCKGAIYEYDLDLAFPEYPARPMTYESAIKRRLAQRVGSRISPLQMFFPAWWTKTYTTKAGTPTYMVPTGVSEGDKWTGMVTRDTGSRQQVWSGYISGLLSAMWTERGRWTIDLDYKDPLGTRQMPPRTPAMFHRDIPSQPPLHCVVIDPVDPGVAGSLRNDWSQTANEYYGQGTSLSGVAYSGMEIDSKGVVIGYTPLDAARQVWPPLDRNGWLQKNRMRRMNDLQLPPGLTAEEAADVARFQRRQFSTPGLTGTVSLKTDPKMVTGKPILRHLIRPGMTALILGTGGNRSGTLCYVTEVAVNFKDGSVELTVDSKWRERLTVREVQLRGRDALSINRQLIGGQFQPPVPDQLYPWDYGAGSGMIPSGPDFSAQRFFKDMPPEVLFPWEPWALKHPPKSSAWKDCYVHIGPKNANANLNWSGFGPGRVGYPVRMAQAGSIMRIEVAAFDRDGHIKRVGFSLSFWMSSGTNYQNTPVIPPGGFDDYPAAQHNPFFPGAWEEFKDDGTRWNAGANQNAEQTAGLVSGALWGAGSEKAGYFPGDSGIPGNAPTGLLVDENQWSFDLTQFNQWDPYEKSANLSNAMAGHLYVLIYCDDQGDEDVYFIGRAYRQPPGAST